MTAQKRVAVVMFPLRYQAAKAAQGISAYARQQGNWTLWPERLLAGPMVVAGLKAYAPDGILTQVYSVREDEALRVMDCPIVDIGATMDRPAWHPVLTDDVETGRSVARYFLERSFANFAFVGCTSTRCFGERETGFRLQLGEAGVPDSRIASLPLEVVETASGERREQGPDPEPLKAWLCRLPKPTAMMLANDMLAITVMRACAEVGIQVPQDVAMMGVDNEEGTCQMVSPELSSVPLDMWRVGFEAARELDRMMNGQPKPAEPTRVPPLPPVVRPSSDAFATEDEHVHAALRYIYDHSGDVLRVSDVLRAVDLSRRPLERRFRKVLGRTIRDEIERVHVERAKRMLVETDLAMPKIASTCGFTDAKQFSTRFRIVTGESPTAYRSQYRQR